MVFSTSFVRLLLTFFPVKKRKEIAYLLDHSSPPHLQSTIL